MSRRVSILALLVCACAPSMAFVPTNPSPRALSPRPSSEVQVITEGAPDRPAVEVGIVTATSNQISMFNGDRVADPPELISAIRDEAARQGCDAVKVRPGAQASYEGICFVYR